MTTRTIPAEYLAFRKEDDFGFSAVDESTLTRLTDPTTLQDTIIVRETVEQSSESLHRVEEKLDTMLALYNQGKLGLDAERQNMTTEVQANLKELEQLIMPLLVNLMKNPEKEYILWPNRVEKVEEFEDMISEIIK